MRAWSRLRQIAVLLCVSAACVGLNSCSDVTGPAHNPPAKIDIVSGASQSTPAGAQAPDSLMVRVTDKFGNPVQNVRFDWAVADGWRNAEPNGRHDIGHWPRAYLLDRAGNCWHPHSDGTVQGLPPAVFPETGPRPRSNELFQSDGYRRAQKLRALSMYWPRTRFLPPARALRPAKAPLRDRHRRRGR